MTGREGTHYDPDGDRWYTDPRNPTSHYAGVTSVLNTRNKPYLVAAKVNGAARYAAKNRKALAEMTQAGVLALLKSQDEVLPDWKVARQFGKAAHQVVENLITGKPLDHNVPEVEGTATYPVSNTFTTWVASHWAEFNKAHRVEVLDVEQTVFNTSHSYAGSFDLVVKLDGKVTMLDIKTNKGGPSSDVALQNTAYAKADQIVNMSTGALRPMHDVEQSAVLWMREEGWAAVPLRFDDDVWRVFYGLLLAFKWGKIDEATAIGEPVSGTLAIPKRWGA